MTVADDSSAIQLCGLRVSRLDATGAPVVGATHSFVTDKQVSLAFNPVNREGTEIEVVNGCDAVITDFKGADAFKRVTVTLTLGTPNPELAELLAGFALVTGAGNTIGASYPAVGAAPPNGVCLETWAKAWLGGGPPTALAYWRFVFPRVVLSPSDETLENAALAQVFTGPGSENANITANGPHNDWPAGLTTEERAVSYWRDATAPPAAGSSYVATPVQA